MARTLGISRDSILDAAWIVNGPEWLGVRLSNADEVLGLTPNSVGLHAFCIGVVGPHPAGHETQFEVRAFVGDGTVTEDPVTGSLNAGLARWMIDTGLVHDDYTAGQGTTIGYEGRVQVGVDDQRIWIGGNTILCVQGQVDL